MTHLGGAAPGGVGLVKSSGVSLTGSSVPVGIRSAGLGVFVGVEPEFKCGDGVEVGGGVAKTLSTGEVEVGVVGDVDEGGFVGGGFVGEREFVVVVEGEGELEREVAGEAAVAVFADVGEQGCGLVVGGGEGFAFPVVGAEVGVPGVEGLAATET